MVQTEKRISHKESSAELTVNRLMTNALQEAVARKPYIGLNADKQKEEAAYRKESDTIQNELKQRYVSMTELAARHTNDKNITVSVTEFPIEGRNGIITNRTTNITMESVDNNVYKKKQVLLSQLKDTVTNKSAYQVAYVMGTNILGIPVAEAALNTKFAYSQFFLLLREKIPSIGSNVQQPNVSTKSRR